MSGLNGFRTRITSFILGHKRDAVGKEVPVISSQHGQTSEGMRLQAAMNMKLDPVVRARVEEALVRQMGSVARGLAEARRRYPEAYSD